MVAKWRRASYRPGQRGWIKMKNPEVLAAPVRSRRHETQLRLTTSEAILSEVGLRRLGRMDLVTVSQAI